MANITQREVFIMEYRRFGNTIYLRLDPKEEILEEIGKVAKKENIRLAQVTGLGAINDFTAGVYSLFLQHSDKGIPLYSVPGSV